MGDTEDDEPKPKSARVQSVSSPQEVNPVKQEPPGPNKQQTQNKVNDSDVDDLLGTDSEEEKTIKPTPTKKTDKVEKVEKMEAPKEEKKKVIDISEKSRLANLKEREREMRRKKELERTKEKERREQRAKPYSRTELRKELEMGEKDKIKKIAAQLKEQNKGKSLIAGLGRIPKLPKKEPPPSFDSILGSMDTKPKVVKAPPGKNKNKDLLESLAGGKTNKPKSKQELEKERIAAEKKRQEEEEQKRIQDEKERIEQEEREKLEREEQEKIEQQEKEREEKERLQKEEEERMEKEKQEKLEKEE